MVCPLHDHLRDYPKAQDSIGPMRDMYNLMAEGHKDQIRKLTGERYIAHTTGVEDIVASVVKNDKEVLMAALGHDLLEDTKITVEDIECMFGGRVAKIIQGVTKDSSIEDPQKRKEAYLARLADEGETDEGSVIVALADKIYNIADMIENSKWHGSKMWRNFKSGPDQQLWWYRSVLEIGQKRLPDCELNEYLSELIDLFETEVIGRRDGVESVSDVTE